MSKFHGLGNSVPRKSISVAANDDCRESLLDVIEHQIIPRLINAQPNVSSLPHLAADEEVGEPVPEMLEFTTSCLKGDAVAVNLIIDRLIDRGLKQDRIFLELITPAARHLGEMWDQDLCSFSDVTCGLALMHQITYRLGYGFHDGPVTEGQTQSVMLCCAPGSQHFLGLTIVADFFKRDGASVVIEISSTESELVRVVANEWFDVVGISVALESQLGSLASLIEKLRQNSGNPAVKVLLGGPIFTLMDLPAQRFGADAISTDPIEAVGLLKKFANPSSR